MVAQLTNKQLKKQAAEIYGISEGLLRKNVFVQQGFNDFITRKKQKKHSKN